MDRVIKIINNSRWKYKENDEIMLDCQDRNRRRIKLISKKNIPFLLDEKKNSFFEKWSTTYFI